MGKRGNKSDVILTAAKIVFASEGYHNSSVSRIAKEAGIGDGTVYLYFENKEDILIIRIFRCSNPDDYMNNCTTPHSHTRGETP